MRGGSARGGESVYRLGDGADGEVSLDACRRDLDLRAYRSVRGGVRATLEGGTDDASPVVVPTTLF